MTQVNTFEAARAAAEDDISRLLQGCEVPAEYRKRLLAYIQCWYLDQGHHGVRVCDLPHRAPAASRGRGPALAA
jgi:hypothetical protein